MKPSQEQYKKLKEAGVPVLRMTLLLIIIIIISILTDTWKYVKILWISGIGVYILIFIINVIKTYVRRKKAERAKKD